MPVIQVRSLPPKDGVDVAATLSRVACRVAEIVGVPEQAVFATWEPIAPGCYVEGRNVATVQPDATHPPIVSLILFEGRPADKIERVVTTVAEQVAEGFRLAPGNVFVNFVEATSGRLYTGGRLRRRTP